MISSELSVLFIPRSLWFLTIGIHFLFALGRSFLYNVRKYLNWIWHRDLWDAIKKFTDGIELAWFLVELHSLFQCLCLPPFLLNPEWKVVLNVLFIEKNIVSKNTLFTIPFKVTLFAIIITFTFQFFVKLLEITSPIHASSWSWDLIFIVSKIHSSKNVDLAFNGLIIF